MEAIDLLGTTRGCIIADDIGRKWPHGKGLLEGIRSKDNEQVEMDIEFQVE
jgi:hypothetical protein